MRIGQDGGDPLKKPRCRINRLEDLCIDWPVKCYNGAYDSDTSRVFLNRSIALADIRDVYPKARLVHFPMEDEYVVSVVDNGVLTLSPYCVDPGVALWMALEKVFELNGPPRAAADAAQMGA